MCVRRLGDALEHVLHIERPLWPELRGEIGLRDDPHQRAVVTHDRHAAYLLAFHRLDHIGDIGVRMDGVQPVAGHVVAHPAADLVVTRDAADCDVPIGDQSHETPVVAMLDDGNDPDIQFTHELGSSRERIVGGDALRADRHELAGEDECLLA